MWFDAQWSVIEHKGLHSFPEGNITFSQGNKNTFFKKFNEYLNSDSYDKSMRDVLQSYGMYCRWTSLCSI